MDIKLRVRAAGTSGSAVTVAALAGCVLVLIWPAAAGIAAPGGNDAAASDLAATENVVAYLSLQRNPRDVTIAALGEATSSVTAVIYKFDDPVLMAPIRATIERGVQVQVLLDGKEAAKKKSQSAELVAAGAEVRIWPSTQGKLHAKFVIIDGVQALTGSYNWSRSGGDENVELLIVDTDRELIGALQEHFGVLWAKSLPISGP